MKSNLKAVDYNKLPSFIAIDHNAWGANVIVKTIIAMKEQKFSFEGRRKLVQHLNKLFVEIA